MDQKDFCYWLQGFLEISDVKELTPQQLQIVKDHLKLVFTKVTPQYQVQIGGQGSTGRIDLPFQGLIGGGTTGSGMVIC